MKTLLPDACRFDWDSILALHRASGSVLLDWSRADYQYEKDEELEALHRAETDLKAIRDLARLQCETRPLSTVVEHPGIRLEDLESLAAEVNDLVGATGNHWRTVFNGARRIRSAIAGGAATDDLDETRSWLDRVDAITHAVEQSNLSRVRAFVAGGVLVLGTALRDSDLLLRWLDDSVAESPADRESVIMALALLGYAPPVEQVWPDRSDPQRAAVLVAATALAIDDSGDRQQALDRLDLMAEGASTRRVTENALLLAQTSNRLSVVG